jgi:hypothetical protein
MSIDYRRGALLIAAPNALIARHWIEQTLIPYLRYAFSHAIPYGADIVPRIQRAIDFCMSQAVGISLRVLQQQRLTFPRLDRQMATTFSLSGSVWLLNSATRTLRRT